MFYVYAHLDPLTNEVRYIGKGKDRRAWSFSHRKGHQKNWINYLKNLGLKPIVQIIIDNLSESEALKEEKRLIPLYSNLTNLTSGGEGVSGLKHSEEFKQWIRDFNTGKKQSKEAIANMVITKVGKPRTAEEKIKISKGKLGIQFSDEHRRKLSEARRKRVTK